MRWLAHELVAGITAPPFHRAMAAHAFAVGVAGNAASVYAGACELRRGGRFGDRARVPVSIGGEAFHGISDKRTALELLHASFLDLKTDMLAAAPSGQLAPSIAATFDAFDLFYDRETDSILIRWATEWATYQAWWQRLRAMREACRAAGVSLASPEPPPLPRTVWQRGAEGIGSRVDAAISLGRSAMFTTMTVMGVFGLLSAMKSLRELKSIGVE